MNKSEKIQNLRKAFQTILRTDYISISDINQSINDFRKLLCGLF